MMLWDGFNRVGPNGKPKIVGSTQSRLADLCTVVEIVFSFVRLREAGSPHANNEKCGGPEPALFCPTM